MRDDFTPTMEYVREFYAKFQANLHMHSDYDDEAYELAEAEFERVMAAHDAEVSEKARRDAIEEAVEATRNGPGWYRDDAERSVRRLIAVPTPPDAAEKTQ